MTNKINRLETLRGFAALAVALFHYPSTSLLHVKGGHLGVYFFFALSGFVISLNYFNRLTNRKNLVEFQIKRFFRLYPIHIFLLLIVMKPQSWNRFFTQQM